MSTSGGFGGSTSFKLWVAHIEMIKQINQIDINLTRSLAGTTPDENIDYVDTFDHEKSLVLK